MRVVLVFLLALLPPWVTADIYKIVDAQGRITFTDEPPKDGQYERVELEPTNVTSSEAPQADILGDPAKVRASVHAYRDFAVLSPLNNSSVRENAGNVDVALSLSPELDTQAGHSVVVWLDEVPVADGTSLDYRLTNVDRGSHSLRAEVRDTGGNSVVTTAPIQFTLHRVSVMSLPPPDHYLDKLPKLSKPPEGPGEPPTGPKPLKPVPKPPTGPPKPPTGPPPPPKPPVI